MPLRSELIRPTPTMRMLAAAALMPAGIIVAHLLAISTQIPDLSALLLTLVVFSGLLGGVWLGLWAAALQIIYSLWAYSHAELGETVTFYLHWWFGEAFPLSLSDIETKTLITYLIAAPVVAIAAGLSRRALESTRRLTTAREKFTNKVFEQAGVAIAYANVDGTILRCNQSLSDIVGYAPDEIAGKKFTELVDPRDRDQDWGVSRQLLAGAAGKFTWESRYLRKDGKSVWSRKVLTLIRDEPGEPSHFLSFMTDISDEIALRAELAQSEANYRTLWETSGNANFLVFAPDFRIEQGNAAAVRFFGVGDQQQLAALRLSDLSPERQDDDELSTTKEQRLMADALRDGRAAFEWHFQAGDGADTYATVNVTRIEVLGRLGLQCSAVDITDRVMLARHQADARRLLAEEVNARTAELEEVTYELHLAQSVGSMGSFSVDLVADTFSCSPETARILNIEEFDRIETGKWAAKVHPGDLEAVRDAWRKAIDGAPYDVTYRIMVPGGVRHVKTGAKFKRDGQGKAVSAIGAILDLTSLLANREQNVLRGYKARMNGLLAATAAVQADAEQDIDTDPRQLAASLVQQFPDWSAEELDTVIEQAIATIRGPKP